MTRTPDRVRLAELVATISLGTDLGLGQPMEHVIRHTLIALRMAELLGLDDAERDVVYYAGLLGWVGCHTDAYEQAKWFGDDIALKRDSFRYDQGRPPRRSPSLLRDASGPATRPWPGLGSGLALPAGGAARRSGRLLQPLAGRRRADRAARARRRRPPEPEGELRALGRARAPAESRVSEIRLTSRLVIPRRRGHRVLRQRRPRRGRGRRPGAQRHPVRPRAGRPVLPACACAAGRSRRRRAAGTR